MTFFSLSQPQQEKKILELSSFFWSGSGSGSGSGTVAVWITLVVGQHKPTAISSIFI